MMSLPHQRKKHPPTSSPPSNVLPPSTAYKVQSIILVLKVNQLFPFRSIQCLCVCASVWVFNWEQTTAMNTPYNQGTISHPYKTRKNNMWNRRLCKVTNHISNYLQPDKQCRPSVEAEDCSKAFIRRRNGHNNGIIVLDDACLSRRYLHRPANFCWHRVGSAWQSRRCHVVSVYVCMCLCVCVCAWWGLCLQLSARVRVSIL